MRILLGLLITSAIGAAQVDKPSIEIFIPPVINFGMELPFMQAREVVNRIYSEIGIRVIWRSSSAHPSACSKEPSHGKIVVAFANSTSNGATDLALAYSHPYKTEGPCIFLLIDRLREELRFSPSSTGPLMGHVLAHEMGHVLQGISRHSETGIMKALWSSKEIRDMPKSRLHFANQDAELIMDALAGHTRRAVASKHSAD